GDHYLSKVYCVISSISELNFESLPERFVAKPTHQSGKVYFVKNKNELNKKHFVHTLNNWLHSKYEAGTLHGEYWYTDIPPRIMFEEWLTGGRYNIPLDFKFFVFNGCVQAIQVDFDRFTRHAINFYTREWTQIPMRKGDHPNKLIDPGEIRPAKLEEMIAVAETLGNDFDFVRIDLYYLFNSCRVVFGEMTFAPGSGYSRFVPNYYDLKFGDLWQISSKSSRVTR
ncbi:MAG: ATP-grasp fold amidoligase family protein, partial [Candidatus Kryptoniota bacterium]